MITIRQDVGLFLAALAGLLLAATFAIGHGSTAADAPPATAPYSVGGAP